MDHSSLPAMTYLTPGTTSMGADFLRRFRPCVVNYIVQFRRSLASGAYFITPHSGYSSQRSAHPPQNDPNDLSHPLSPPYGLSSEEVSVPDIINYGIWYIGDETECEQKLDRDLALL